MSCPDYQYYEESQERMRCSNCVYEECGCDGYPKNSSFCCTRSYPCDSDDDEEGGFTMGSILRQVWFIFIVMGVISTIIWRRPACHRVPFPPPTATALPPSLLCSARCILPLYHPHHTTAFGAGRRLRQRRMLMAQQQATLPHQVESLSRPTSHHP